MESLHEEIIHKEMEFLPEVIIREEILPRLPVKSLLTFRCVSKSWHYFISREPFINIQHQNSKKDPYFLKQMVILKNKFHLPKQCSVESLLSEEPVDPSPLDTLSTAFQVLGCYNGLICIHNNTGEFYLWNPSTRISKKLPQIINGRLYALNCGFGWDESSGEYKVFAHLGDSNYKDMNRVYSSKTKSWKTIKYDVKNSPQYFDVGVFVGGKLHWKKNQNDIIFLDLKSEEYGRIELPFDEGNFYNERLGQIGGCLCLLDLSLKGDVRIWVMKESWERLEYLSLDHELLQRPFSTSSFTRKGSNGEIFVFHGSTFLVYDPRDNMFRVPKVCHGYASHHVYVESLLSPEDL